jgi:dienelactone hydrolase
VTVDFRELRVHGVARFRDVPFVWRPVGSAEAIQHPVLTAGTGPSVILLHEVAGLSPTALTLAEHLVDEGFRVHAPVLYGRPGQRQMVRGAARALWCLRRELSLFREGADSPITQWLRALVLNVASDDHPQVGVIGMCMTGGLAIAALAESATGAAVAAQPSLPLRPSPLPLRGRGDLGLDDAVLQAAIDADAPLLALRYQRDWICPRQRLETIEERFGDGTNPVAQPHPVDPAVTTRDWPRLRLIEIEGRRHSTLTDDGNDAARDEVVAFLQANLVP